MNIQFFSLIVLASLLTACASVPNSALDQARASFSSAQNNPQVVALAPEELKRAGESLRVAEKASTDGSSTATVDHLAYLSSQRTAIAQDTASSRSSQAVTAGASAERDRTRLAMRTSEADAAQRQLALSQQSNAQKTSELAAADAAALLEQARLARSDARVGDLEMQLRDLNAKQTERGMVVTLGDVLFDSGQSRILPAGNGNMAKLADFFNRNPQRTASIEGYTDSIGSPNANYNLSERRANAVRMALMNLGVPAERLSARAHGAESPVANNGTAAGRQMNRRVEIVIAP